MNASRATALARIEEDEEEFFEDARPSQGNAPLEDNECQPVHSVEREEEGSCLLQTWAVLRGLAPYAKRHRRPFFCGALAAFGVVGAKLALPWPLRAVADLWSGDAHAGLLGYVPQGFDPILGMGLLFLLCGFALGWFDLVERLYFARFALATAKDLRTDAMSQAIAQRMSGAGDLVSRFVGDSSRLSGGLQSFLVHVGTSVVLLLGVIAVLYCMEPLMGGIFTIAGLVTILITVAIARKIFISSLRTRAREGELANRLHDAINDDSEAPIRLRKRGRRAVARHTRLQGIATWGAHGVFGVAVLAALWVGSQAVSQGRMSAGDMVIFMMYALMLQNPIVRLARQGAKSGKILGSAHRLLQIAGSRRGD
ncbi:MAG TPA: ABC transporter transmembrane domain-containing protein [Burkholderiales bacterium]|nr:ABC transporter transmembrane domain-containing protein [Burkholderiales bacterium]